METKRKTTILFAASVLAVFLLNAPILVYFQTGSLFGLPSLVVYTYGMWLCLIVFFAIIIRFTRSEKKPNPQDD